MSTGRVDERSKFVPQLAPFSAIRRSSHAITARR